MSDKPLPQNPPQKPDGKPAGKKTGPLEKQAAENLNAQDEMLQKLLARMAEEDPARVAEIIRMWLKQDQK